MCYFLLCLKIIKLSGNNKSDWSDIILKKVAFFLDRDGVLNFADKRPPNTPQELQLLPQVASAIKKIREMGYLVFVVTNQGGVGLGYMTEQQLTDIHVKLLKEIEKDGGKIDEIKVCIHKPHTGCACRKPKPGMLLELADKYDIDLTHSYMVGDRDVDILAGQAAGTKTVFIGPKSAVPENVDLVAPSLIEAVERLFT